MRTAGMRMPRGARRGIGRTIRIRIRGSRTMVRAGTAGRRGGERDAFAMPADPADTEDFDVTAEGL